ncbi:MAG: NIL domain-containing protein [Planctomycetota bacterium]
MARKKVFLTFPQQLVKEPIVWQIGQEFKVVTNIRGASITEDLALFALMLEGESDNIAQAIQYLAERGVKVESLEEEEE